MKKGAPPCGLYLRIGPNIDMPKAVAALRQAALVINRSDYERNMHSIEITPGDGAESWGVAAGLVELAKLSGMTALIKGHAEFAGECGADGVLLKTLDEFSAARGLLGDKAIIGLTCGHDQAQAEKALAAEADFVAFGGAQHLPAQELIGWWATATAIPMLVSGPVDNDNAGLYVQAGASFLDCGAYIFGHAKGVLQGTVNMLYAIDLALQSVQKH